MDLIERIEGAILAPFDYSVLDPLVASRARASADRIRDQFKKVHASFIDTGRELLGIKDQLGHGNFGPWLDAEFQMDERTAQRYMSAAAAFGDKSDIVSVLPQTTVIELAAPSTPEHVREEVVKRIEAGEKIKPFAIKTMVREARETEREKRKFAKLTPEQQKKQLDKKKRQRRTAEQHRQEMEESRRRHEAEEANQLDAAIEAVSLLQSQLTEEQMSQLARLVEAARSAFQPLLREAAGLKIDDWFDRKWVDRAEARASRDVAA